MMRMIHLALAAAVLGLAAPVLNSPAAAQAEAPAGDLVAVLGSHGQFETFARAVEAAGLDNVLRRGTYTVFAPTDAAFQALPATRLQQLMNPANRAELVEIVTYHMVPGRSMSGALSGRAGGVRTVEGASLDIDGSDGIVVNDARVVIRDVAARNGVIHGIDAVLTP